MKQTKNETKEHIDVSYSIEEEEKTVCFILIVKCMYNEHILA